MSYLPYKITAIKRSDATGLNIMPFATVSILNQGGGYATLREADLTTPIGNPFNCDENGEREVWIQGGSYNISVEGGQSWDIRLSGASDIQSVATIAELRALTGLVNGQVIYVREYETGFKEGGGEFVVDTSLATADNGGTVIVTADGVRCSRRSEIYRAESWGAHSSRADNSSYFQQAADNVGRIDGRPGIIYKFLDQLSITNNFEFNGNKCQVEFGDGHLNLFNLLAAVDFVSIKDVSNTIIKGVADGAQCYKNFYSAFSNTGTIIGFPVGTAHRATQTTISNCVIGESRVFVNGSGEGKATLSELFNRSTTYEVHPCSVLVQDTVDTELRGLVLDGTYSEDLVKVLGATLNSGTVIYNSKFKQNKANVVGEVDIYNGLEGCEIYSNKFYNVQVHRKQSALAGTETNGAQDGIHDNKFYFTGFGGTADFVNAIYWRGVLGTIHNNQFKVRMGVGYTGPFNCISLDEENNDLGPFGQSNPAGCTISNNRADMIGTSGTDNALVKIQRSGTGALNSVKVTGNELWGGNKFLEGICAILTGNTWEAAATSAVTTNSEVCFGNNFKTSTMVRGKPNNVIEEYIAVTTATLDASISGKFRSAGVSVSAISNGNPGDEVLLYARNAITVTHSNDLRLNGAVNASMPVRSFMKFVKVPAADGLWEEIYRSF